MDTFTVIVLIILFTWHILRRTLSLSQSVAIWFTLIEVMWKMKRKCCNCQDVNIHQHSHLGNPSKNYKLCFKIWWIWMGPKRSSPSCLQTPILGGPHCRGLPCTFSLHGFCQISQPRVCIDSCLHRVVCEDSVLLWLFCLKQSKSHSASDSLNHSLLSKLPGLRVDTVVHDPFDWVAAVEFHKVTLSLPPAMF